MKLTRPVYGFHEKEHQFFKVYFYNPVVRKHSYDLLLVRIKTLAVFPNIQPSFI